jgi:hypothetical protein
MADGRDPDARAQVRLLISSWNDIPAILVDRHLDVIESNALARALTDSFETGMNLARYTFLNPDVHRSGRQWESVAAQVAAMLRDSLDEHDDDRAFLDIVGELSTMSRDFSRAWADDSRRASSAGQVPFPRSAVGSVSLGYMLFRIPGDPDDVLIVFGGADEHSRTALSHLVSVVRGEGGS